MFLYLSHVLSILPAPKLCSYYLVKLGLSEIWHEKDPCKLNEDKLWRKEFTGRNGYFSVRVCCVCECDVPEKELRKIGRNKSSQQCDGFCLLVVFFVAFYCRMRDSKFSDCVLVFLCIRLFMNNSFMGSSTECVVNGNYICGFASLAYVTVAPRWTNSPTAPRDVI